MISVRTVLAIFTVCLSALRQPTAEDVIPSHRQDQTSSSPPSSWAGHLKPLGLEATRVPVLVLDYFPSPAEFFQNYVYPSIPVIFRQGAKRSPAFAKWTDDYLMNLPGSEDLITVEMRKVEERQLPRMKMPFAEFLRRYSTHDEYVVTGVPDFLKADVLVPPSLHCTNITANLVDTILWFSSGGTKSHVHTDYVDNINCLFRGQKDFLFVNYTRYRHQFMYDHPEGFYSSVDVERVDFNKFPGMRDIEFLEAKLEAGDCLFVPFKWIHQVNSYGSNVAVNVWWNHKAYVVPTPEACGDPDPGLSLADVSFYFQDVAGAEREDLQPELEFVKNPSGTLTEFMEDKETQSLTEEQFMEFLDTLVPSLANDVWNEEALDLGHQIFHLLDLDGNGKITSRDIELIPIQMNQIDRGSFYVNLGQKLMILSDVIDGEISQQMEEIMRSLGGQKLNEGKTVTVSREDYAAKEAGGQSTTARDEL